MKTKKVELYYLSYCPYCKKLRQFLDDNNVKYELVDVTNDLDLKEKTKEKTGHRTFPQLIIDDTFVGDCSSTIDNFDEIKKEYNL